MQAFLLSKDLLFSSQVTGPAEARGWSVRIVPDLAQLLPRIREADQYLILVDLSTPNLDVRDTVDQLRGWAWPPIAILAFGPHVHQAKLDAAIAAGCDHVLTRGQMSSGGAKLLQEYFEAGS